MNLHIWIRCSWFYIVRRYFCDLKWSQIKVCISLTRKTILLAHPSVKDVTNAALRTAEMFERYILRAFNTSTNELKWPSSILNLLHPLLRAMISFNCDFTPIKKMSEVLYAVKGGKYFLFSDTVFAFCFSEFPDSILIDYCHVCSMVVTHVIKISFNNISMGYRQVSVEWEEFEDTKGGNKNPYRRLFELSQNVILDYVQSELAVVGF
jgi:hypothetical protein